MAKLLTILLLTAVTTLANSLPYSGFLDRVRRREPEVFEFPSYDDVDDPYLLARQPGEAGDDAGRRWKMLFSTPNFRLPTFKDFAPATWDLRPLFQQFRDAMNRMQAQIDALWNNTASSWHIGTNFFGLGDLPPNYHNSSYDTKVVNGSRVTVNETISTNTDDGSSSFFHFKVVHVSPEASSDESKQHPGQDSQTAENEAETEAVSREQVHPATETIEETWDNIPPAETNEERDKVTAETVGEWGIPPVEEAWDNVAAADEGKEADVSRSALRYPGPAHSHPALKTVLSNVVGHQFPAGHTVTPLGRDLRVNWVRARNGLHMVDPAVQLVDVVHGSVVVPERRGNTVVHKW